MQAKPEMFMGFAFVDREIALADVLIDEAIFQPRTRYDETKVSSLEAAYDRGDDIPSPRVFCLDSGRLVLVDGHHRWRALARRGRLAASVKLARGTVVDARIFAAGANAGHGMEMTLDDRRKAVRMLLETPGVFGDWSEQRIATHVRASRTAVQAWTSEWCDEKGEAKKMTERGGKTVAAKRKLQSKNLPDFSDASRCQTARGDEKWSISWKSKKHYLGPSESVAREKFASLMADGTISPREADAQRSLESSAVIQFLRRSLDCPIETRPVGRNQFLFSEFRVGRPGSVAVVKIAKGLKQKSIPAEVAAVLLDAIGGVLMDRSSTGAARAVVLCYLPEDCRELAATALKLGVEFLSPDEFVASVNDPAPVAVDA